MEIEKSLKIQNNDKCYLKLRVDGTVKTYFFSVGGGGGGKAPFVFKISDLRNILV